MRVLVVYASRYGATQGIAERIGAILRQQGLEATVEAVQDAGDPVGFDGVVIGSAVFYGHWMEKAARFVRRNQTVLANRPVWLFSSGPVGTDLKDSQGRDLCVVATPEEIAEFTAAVYPRNHRVFFGALHRGKLGHTYRLLLKLFGKRGDALFPEGDFRDWLEVEAWAREIAGTLKSQVRDVVVPVALTAA